MVKMKGVEHKQIQFSAGGSIVVSTTNMAGKQDRLWGTGDIL